MAKEKNGKKSMLLSPFYSAPGGNNLGPHRVEGPKGPKSPSDPIGLTNGKFRGGPSGEQRKQSHDKD